MDDRVGVVCRAAHAGVSAGTGGGKVSAGGSGCRKAVANVNGMIAGAVCGKEFSDQEQLDRELIGLDGTGNKSRLGANAILVVSIAFARAVAAMKGVPLYHHLRSEVGGGI